ncbi:MAG: hypothetical protein JJ899_09235 [Alphaproteobacteria bacterium]|nr:hypothetical protein [Alphaproteobacteria bacterium]
MTGRLLIHVEDPGAANWVVALVPALKTAGRGFEIVCEAGVSDYLSARGVSADILASDVSPAELLDERQPEAILAGTSENLDSRALALIDAARKRGLPTAAFVDQGGNAEHRFRGRTDDPLAHAPDWLFVPDRDCADAFEGLGFKGSRLVVSGNPHLDRARQVAGELAAEGRAAVRRRVAPDAPTDRPLVVFLAEIGYVVNPEGPDWERELQFTGRDGTAPRAARILEEVLDALNGVDPSPWIVLRLHPKNTADEFAAYAGEVDAVSAGGDPLALLWAADLVVGMSSSPLEETHAMGRPALSVLPHPAERKWLAGLASGAIACVETRDDLRRILPGMLNRIDSRHEVAIPSPAAPRIVAALDDIRAAA